MTSLIYRTSKNHSAFFRLQFSLFLRNFSSSSGNRVIAAEYLSTHHNFSPEVASKLSISRSIDPDNCDSVISVLKSNGFSHTDVERIFRRNPSIVSASPLKTVEPKLKVFLDSGFSPAETTDVLVTDPSVLRRSTDHLSSTVSKLKEILGSTARVHHFLKVGRFPSTSLEKNLIPNIKLLHGFGLKPEQIERYMSRNPSSFFVQPHRLMELVNKANEFGISRTCNMLLPTIGALSCISKGRWERKMKMLKGFGFGEDDIAQMLRRMPLAFIVSEKKMIAIMKFLASTGDIDISAIVGCPLLLMFSLEKRLKPRLLVIEALKERNLLHDQKPNLVTVFKLTNVDFMNKFVLPYSHYGISIHF